MIFTDGEPTICSVGTEIKPVEKTKPRDYKIAIRNLVRVQYASYLHSFNCSEEPNQGYFRGKMNACLDILDRIEIL